MSDQENIGVLETEWSHFVKVDDLNNGTTRLKISPNEDARGRMASRLVVDVLNSLDVDVEISRRSGQAAFHVSAIMRAVVTQNCVVTMEAIENKIEDSFEAWFSDPDAPVSIAKARHEQLTKKGHGEQPILEEKDDPEPIQNGKIDLGELVTQYLCLSIDPYPHAKGVEFEHVAKGSVDGQEDDLIGNPFAALKDWKDKFSGGEDS